MPDEEGPLGTPFELICDRVFDLPIKTFSDINLDELSEYPTIDLSDLYWQFIVSVILIHEATHIRLFQTKDISYNWDRIMQLDATQAIINADNYMYLGVLARLEDWNFTLDWDQDKAIAGVVVKDNLIEHQGSV
ncbi:MAG: hypothetical protein Q9217_004424 [Psora testacea]